MKLLICVTTVTLLSISFASADPLASPIGSPGKAAAPDVVKALQCFAAAARLKEEAPLNNPIQPTTEEVDSINNLRSANWCNCQDGFFWQSSSKQCFKLFSNPNAMGWPHAQRFCSEQGLRLAHPTDPIRLRAYLVLMYTHLVQGNSVMTWLNCKYESSIGEYEWQDGSNDVLKTGSHFWLRRPPPCGCLLLLASDYMEKVAPNKPYDAHHCDAGFYHVLCEKIPT